MTYNTIKNNIEKRFKKLNDIKLNKHHIKHNNMIFKPKDDYFIIDYSNNYLNYDY
ncbi:hypothetical protein J6W34_04960 [bacterium]|nr:hypothetical protein [bacterium]